jgi:hypothetical protein
MKAFLEAVVFVAALLLGGLLVRECRARDEARRAASTAPFVGETSDPPVPGTPPPARAVSVLPPVRMRAHPRIIEKAAPPPPPSTSGN